MECAGEVAVARAVEPAADGSPRAGRDGRSAGEHVEGGVTAASGVRPGGEHGGGGRDRADSWHDQQIRSPRTDDGAEVPTDDGPAGVQDALTSDWVQSDPVLRPDLLAACGRSTSAGGVWSRPGVCAPRMFPGSAHLRPGSHGDVAGGAPGTVGGRT
jgi:hypothetical protein